MPITQTTGAASTQPRSRREAREGIGSRPPKAVVGSQVSQEEEIFGKVYDRHVVRRLWKFVGPYRNQILLSVAAVLLFTLTQLAIPLVIRYAIDNGMKVGATDRTMLIVAAAMFALYALTVAHQPADEKHPYGHGKIEFFSAGFEGGMIVIAALVAMAKAIDTLIHGHELDTSNLMIGTALMVVALFVNGVFGSYLIQLGKKRVSITLEADGWHLITDAVTSAAALAALIIVKMSGWKWVDPVTAILVSLHIAWTGVGLIRRSAGGLMDAQDFADETMIRQILDAHLPAGGKTPMICSYHKLRHRHTGRYHWVDFHIVVPARWDVEQGHNVASAIEYEIEQALGEGNATAHVEPCEDKTCDTCKERLGVIESDTANA